MMAGKHRRPRSGESDRKTTVYLNEELKDRAIGLADQDGRSLSSFVEIALREKVEQLEREQSKGVESPQ